MRTLFICSLLGALVWLIQQGARPVSEPAAYLGILIILPVLASRVAARSGLPHYLGALIAGFLMGPTGLISRTALDAVQPFADLATAWVGLYVGVSLSPSMISDRRSLYVAFTAVVGAILTTFGLLSLTGQIPPAYAFQMGILAALAAPFFTQFPLPIRREALPLPLLTTGMGLVLWTILQATRTPAVLSLPQILLAIALWAIGIEGVYQSLRRIRTEPGRTLLFGAITFLILIASRPLQLSPLFLSLLTGLVLSLRCGQNREPFQTLGVLSKVLISLMLGHFAARLNPVGALRLSAGHWQILLIYAASMSLGKTVGSLLGSRTTASPVQGWSQILPQGVLAATLLPLSLPSREFFTLPPPAALETGFVLLCGIAIPILFQPIQALGEKINIGRIQITSRK